MKNLLIIAFALIGFTALAQIENVNIGARSGIGITSNIKMKKQVPVYAYEYSFGSLTEIDKSYLQFSFIYNQAGFRNSTSLIKINSVGIDYNYGQYVTDRLSAFIGSGFWFATNDKAINSGESIPVNKTVSIVGITGLKYRIDLATFEIRYSHSFTVTENDIRDFRPSTLLLGVNIPIRID